MAFEGCFSCEAVTLYSNQAAGYAEKLTEALQTPMLLLMASLGGLWIVIEAIRLGMQTARLGDLLRSLITFMFASAALASGGPMIQAIYSGSLDLMGGIAAVAFQVGGGVKASTGQADGIVNLVANAELAVQSVLEAAQKIAWKGTMVSPQYWLYGLLIALPYLVLSVLYMAQVTMGIFRLMMLATFSPLLILCTGFKQTTPMAMAGARTLVSSMLVVFACTVAVSMIIYGVTSLDIASGVKLERSEDSVLVNGKILIAVTLGWLGTALLFEATGIANSIAQTMLSNTGAATMTGGVVGSGLAAMRAANPATMGRRFLSASGAVNSEMAGWSAMTSPAQQHAAQLLEKYKTINQPKPPASSSGRDPLMNM